MTIGAPVVIDTSLLVLLVVGTTDKSLIPRHKRTRSYVQEDYDLLLGVLRRFDQILVTPNILTEASNLLGQIGEPARGTILATLAHLIAVFSERYIPSSEACARPEFIRLGLADSATILGTAAVRCVITDDLDLYLALQNEGRPAFNFNHLRLGGWEGMPPFA